MVDYIKVRYIEDTETGSNNHLQIDIVLPPIDLSNVLMVDIYGEETRGSHTTSYYNGSLPLDGMLLAT